MIALAAVAFLSVLGLAVIGWAGSATLFNPPRMLPSEIRPDLFSLPYESVEFSARDGLRLRGWLIPASSPTNKTVLLCHGWGDNKGDLLQHLHFLAKEFNLFLFDFRHHGESDRDKVTLGCLESRDADAAVAFLRSARPAWAGALGVFGHSMGASLAIWAAARHPEVKAVALEAPFFSYNEVVGQWIKNGYRLPFYPFAWLILFIVRLRLGEDPEAYSPARHIEKIRPRPLFLIAGEKDLLMPPAVVRRLYDCSPEPKELWVVPGADHGECVELGGTEYRERLSGFFRERL